MISSFKRGSSFPALILIGLLSTAAFFVTRSTAEEARNVPAPAVDEQTAGKTSEVAVIAGGCFWGVQGVFQHVAGVTNAVSGYAGGDKSTAHYEMTSNGNTGHAESVQITYDPRKITYGRILQVYFSVAHDPTELNRQGPDSGTQYRSAIFPMNDEQAQVAKAYIAQLDAAMCSARRSSPRSSRARRSIAPRTTTRTFWPRTPATPTSSTTTCPRSPI
jgi:peptide-methionine (S)-S-oxide reductase